MYPEAATASNTVLRPNPLFQLAYKSPRSRKLRLDDLWISYFGKKIAGYDIKLLKTDIRFIHDNNATAKHLVQEKQNFTDKYILGENKLREIYND